MISKVGENFRIRTIVSQSSGWHLETKTSGFQPTLAGLQRFFVISEKKCFLRCFQLCLYPTCLSVKTEVRYHFQALVRKPSPLIASWFFATTPSASVPGTTVFDNLGPTCHPSDALLRDWCNLHYFLSTALRGFIKHPQFLQWWLSASKAPVPSICHGIWLRIRLLFLLSTIRPWTRSAIRNLKTNIAENSPFNMSLPTFSLTGVPIKV